VYSGLDCSLPAGGFFHAGSRHRHSLRLGYFPGDRFRGCQGVLELGGRLFPVNSLATVASGKKTAGESTGLVADRRAKREGTGKNAGNAGDSQASKQQQSAPKTHLASRSRGVELPAP
jgi:hypothetical protein